MFPWWGGGKIVRYWPEGSRSESGWATIDLFPQYFSSSYKTYLSTFKSNFQVLHQRFRAQTSALLTAAFAPLPR